MVGVLFLGLMSKLHDWDDSAMFFDGSSIGESRFAVSETLGLWCCSVLRFHVPYFFSSDADSYFFLCLLFFSNYL
jgi:hypothetical protein